MPSGYSYGQDKQYSIPTSYRRKDKINVARILENQIVRINNTSSEGKRSMYCQCVDDLSDFLDPYKDELFAEGLAKINAWKKREENTIHEMRKG